MAMDRSSGNPGWLLTWFKANGEKLRARTGITSFKPLGCGHYGCVFPTDDPAWVVKITRDPTEGPMVQRIMELRKRDGADTLLGIVYYRAIFHGGTIKWRGKSWPVYVIVREAVKPTNFIHYDHGILFPKDGTYNPQAPKPVSEVENIPSYVVERSLKALAKAKQAAVDYVEMWEKAKKQGGLRGIQQIRMERAQQAYVDALTDVGDAFPYVSETMFDLLDEEPPIVLRDVHQNNIGLSVVDQPRRDAGTVIIHDLGHTPTEPTHAFEPLGGLSSNSAALAAGIFVGGLLLARSRR